METIDKYKVELEQDTKIDVLNLRDCQMRLPAIKHKWASRLINHKIELEKTKSLIGKAKDAIINKQLSDPKVKVSRPSLEKSADNNDVVIRLKESVNEQEFVVMYLDKVEQILKSMTFDIKNVTEIMKLEQL